MADEPRRSGRATKGQYTKDRDIAEDAAPKKKGRGKAAKAKQVEEEVEEEEEDESEELIRCICGTYEEEEDVPRAMICCDNCSAWQHNDCMGLPEDYQPEKYFCEQCKPGQHKDLLDAIARGEKPWEEAAKQREAARSSKKKGKKGRKSAAAAPEPQPQPQPQPAEETMPVRGSQKRKAEETPVSDLKAKKVRGTPTAENGTRAASQSRKASTPAQQTKPSGLPQDPSEIANSIRRGAAQGLVKLFGELIKDAVKKGSYKLPSGSTAQGLSLQIGLHVEQGLYSIHSQDEEPTNEYREQLRTIMFNLKKNVDLALRVIKGETAPDKLATMTPKEMQSEEQQRKDAALMKEMEKQHEIVQEQQGPRIRRTHKGEEYVDDAHRIGPESATTKAPNRKPSMAEQDGDSKSRDASARGRQPLSVNTQAKSKPSSADLRRKSSANFDIDKVFSGVQGSPDADTHRFPEADQRGSPQQHAPGAGTDPDIDMLLKDEENESEPYSPKEFNDEGVVWRGTINGNSLGRFHTFAKFAAGAVPEAETLRLTWPQVIPPEIQIHGRIQPQKADEYLCGLEYSNTSDLIVVTMAEPKDSTNLEGFEKFFRYLKTKQRYGVGMQHANPAIKDIYLLPMEAGQALPTFMKALETDFPDPITERMLLVPIVIKNSELPHNLNAGGQPNVMSPSVGPGAVAQTPITPQDGQRDIPLQFTGAVPYPYPAALQQGPNGRSASPSAPTTAQFGTPPPPYQAVAADPIPPNATSAVAAAIRVLGSQLAASPAVQSLVAQAPNVGDDEMAIVRECIRENDRASQDLSILTMMLQARSASSRQQQQQAPSREGPDGASEPSQQKA